MLEPEIPLSHAKRGRASAKAIERVLTRLEQYRCESCGQICIVPHVRILAHSPGSRPVCKPQVPLATGFSAFAA
jgi:esterase/lipase superfamily enzyme